MDFKFNPSTLKIGCCGFSKAKKVYFEEMKLVEIQKTFYSLPKPETAARWKEEAPKNFEFTLKAWQGITHPASSPTYKRSGIKISEEKIQLYGHFNPTDDVFKAWEDTIKIADILSASMILLQSPPSFKDGDKNIRNIETFFKSIDRGNHPVALELRSKWKPDTIKDICERFDISHCVDPFKEDPLYGKLCYFRLHGSPPGKRMYNYKYNNQDFELLMQKVILEIQYKSSVYCLFNNLSMWEDSIGFKAYWERKIGNTR